MFWKFSSRLALGQWNRMGGGRTLGTILQGSYGPRFFASEVPNPAQARLSAILFGAALKDISQLSHQRPSCFISYARGHAQQEEVVHQLATRLKSAGIDVFLDRGVGQAPSDRSNKAGTRLSRFTENIKKVHYVVLAGSLRLMEKYKNEDSGSVINSEVGQIHLKLNKQPGSVIPLVLDGTFEMAIPNFLQDVVGFDWRDRDNDFPNTLELLKRLLPEFEGEVERMRAAYAIQLAWLKDNAEEARRFLETIEKVSEADQSRVKAAITQAVEDWVQKRATEVERMPLSGGTKSDGNEGKLHRDLAQPIDETPPISKEPPVSKDEPFLSKHFWEKVLYGSLGGLMLVIGYLFREDQKEVKKLDKDLDNLTNELEKQALKSRAMLEAKRALQVQPLLFLTTVITEQEVSRHEEDEKEINRQAAALQIRRIELSNVEQGMRTLWFSWFLLRGARQRRIEQLKGDAIQQIEALGIAKAFNKGVLWHKQTKYQDAMKLIEEWVIKKLPAPQLENRVSELDEVFREAIRLHQEGQYSRAKALIEESVIKKLDPSLPGLTEINRIFDPKRILMAAYNAQAKLHACLNKTLLSEEEKCKHGEWSRMTYLKALLLSSKDEERATLLSSLAYWCIDRQWPWLSWPLREEALRLKPHDEHILCGIGLDLQQIGRREEARDYFTKAIRRNPKVPNIFVSRGQLLLELKDNKSARADFEEALKVDANHSAAHFERGLLSWQEGRCREAEQDFQEVLLSPKPHKSRADLRERLERAEPAGGPCKPMSRLFR